MISRIFEIIERLRAPLVYATLLKSFVPYVVRSCSMLKFPIISYAITSIILASLFSQFYGSLFSVRFLEKSLDQSK